MGYAGYDEMISLSSTGENLFYNSDYYNYGIDKVLESIALLIESEEAIK